MNRIEVAIAIVFRQDQVLVCRRRADAHLGGFWEFPGGKVEPGETPRQCVKRELREEVDIEVDVAQSLAIIEHDYPDRQVRLHAFRCEHTSGDPKPLGCELAIWVEPSALRDYRFPPANDQLVDLIINSMSGNPPESSLRKG